MGPSSTSRGTVAPEPPNPLVDLAFGLLWNGRLQIAQNHLVKSTFPHRLNKVSWQTRDEFQRNEAAYIKIVPLATPVLDGGVRWIQAGTLPRLRLSTPPERAERTRQAEDGQQPAQADDNPADGVGRAGVADVGGVGEVGVDLVLGHASLEEEDLLPLLPLRGGVV